MLWTGAVYGFYVPTGHLLFAAGETIRGVAFDLDRLEVKGVPVPVVDGVAMNITDGAAAFDVSETGTLAYLPVDSSVTDTDVVLVDRKGTDRSRFRYAIATTTHACRPTGLACPSTFVRPTPWGMCGCSRSGAPDASGSPRKAAVTSAPNGRRTGKS